MWETISFRSQLDIQKLFFPCWWPTFSKLASRTNPTPICQPKQNRFLFKSVWFPRLVPRHICVAEVSEATSNGRGPESRSNVIVPSACQSLPVRRVEFWVLAWVRSGCNLINPNNTAERSCFTSGTPHLIFYLCYRKIMVVGKCWKFENG